MTRLYGYTLVVLILLGCSNLRDFGPRDAESFLVAKYPYRWILEPTLGFPWIHRYMPRGVAFRAKEFPLREIPPAQPLLKYSPGARFFVGKVRTNIMQVGDEPLPVLVGVLPDNQRLPAAMLGSRNAGQGEFFGLFSDTKFDSKAERKEFAEALAHLVSCTFEFPCEWLPTDVESDEVRVRCSSAKLEIDVRVFFDLIGLWQDEGYFAGAVIQWRLAAQHAH